MKRLSPAKRNQLIAIVFATVAVVSMVYTLLISPQKLQISKLTNETSARSSELQKIKDAIKRSEATTQALSEITEQLNHAEEDVATGDVYAWTYDILRRFKSNYQVDIPSISQTAFSDVDLIHNFPYRQVKLTLNGTAYYHDLGKFVTDFENTFQHMRLVNLVVESVNTVKTPSERLIFHMEIVALVKPNT